MSLFSSRLHDEDQDSMSGTVTDPALYQKQTIRDGSFGRRSKFSCVSWQGDKLLLFGGQTNTHRSDDSIFVISPLRCDTGPPPSSIDGDGGEDDDDDEEKERLTDHRGSRQFEWRCYRPTVANPEEQPPRIRGHSMCGYAPHGPDKPFSSQIFAIFGGKNDHQFFNTVWLLHTSTFEWQRVVYRKPVYPVKGKLSPSSRGARPGPLFPAKRSNHSAAVCGDKMLVFGGITGSNISKSVSRDLWEFDFERYTWCEIVPTVGLVPPERHNHAAAAINGEKWMMIYGGCHNSSRTQYLHDCWIFDTTSTMWHELALFGVPQPLRSDSASAWIGDGYLVIYGGMTKKTLLNDMHVIDLVKESHIGIHAGNSASSPCPRKSHVMCYLPYLDIVVLMGGATKKSILDDMHLIDATHIKKIALGEREFESFKSREREYNDLCDRPHNDLSQEDRFRLGYLAMQLRHFDSALHWFTQYLSTSDSDPSSTLARQERAAANYMLGNYMEALHDLDVVSNRADEDLHENDHERGYHVLKTQCLIKLARYYEARETIKQSPAHIRGSKMMILLESQLQNLDKNIRLFERSQKKGGRKYEKEDLLADDDYLMPESTFQQPSKSEEHAPKNAIRFVVVGTRNSGCTTFMLQLRCIYSESLSLDECRQHRSHIRQITVASIREVVRKLHRTSDSKWLPGETLSLFERILNSTSFNSNLITEMLDMIKEQYFESQVQEIHHSAPHDLDYNFHFFIANARRILSSDYIPTPGDVLHAWGKESFVSSKQYAGSMPAPDDEIISISSAIEQCEDDDEGRHFTLQEIEKSIVDMTTEMEGSLQSVHVRSKNSNFVMIDGSRKDPRKIKSMIGKNFDTIILLVSLADIDAVSGRYSLNQDMIGDVMVATNSTSSVVQGLTMFNEITSIREYKTNTIILLFTHVDAFVHKMSADPTKLRYSFPDFNPRDAPKSIKKKRWHSTSCNSINYAKDFVVKAFEGVNDQISKRRVLVPFFVNQMNKREMALFVRYLREVMYAMVTEENIRFNNLL